jgi:hypothetical protein
MLVNRILRRLYTVIRNMSRQPNIAELGKKVRTPRNSGTTEKSEKMPGAAASGIRTGGQKKKKKRVGRRLLLYLNG